MKMCTYESVAQTYPDGNSGGSQFWSSDFRPSVALSYGQQSCWCQPRSTSCACGHTNRPCFLSACRLLSAVQPIPVSICCALRPPKVYLRRRCGDVSSLRVWPGSGGLELFRLQLRALLGGEPEAVNFMVETPSSELLRLPGLHSYGVASYCAAISAALPTILAAPALAGDPMEAGIAPGTHGQVPQLVSPEATGSDVSYDDWIDLLCSVADILEGEPSGAQSGKQDPEQAPSDAVDGLVKVWVCVDESVDKGNLAQEQ